MSSIQFSHFTGEFVQKAGTSYSYVESAISDRVEKFTQDRTTLNNVLQCFTPERKEFIAKCMFGLGVLYNFKQNMSFFLGGTALGFLASSGKLPEFLRFKTLEGESLAGHRLDEAHLPLLSMKAEDGFQIQKVMAFLAFVNWYLGDTILDNMFFGGFSGLIAGNCLYHSAKGTIDQKVTEIAETTLGKMVNETWQDCSNRVSTLVDGWLKKD